jgi:cobalamin biosynthetic protein CobC
MQALSDVAWTGWTRDRLRRDSARLAILLQKHGLRVIGGTTLFQLAAHTDAPALRDHLGRHGILVRAFDEPTWLRFGLPAPESFARLERALATWRTQQDTRRTA